MGLMGWFRIGRVVGIDGLYRIDRVGEIGVVWDWWGGVGLVG